MQALFTLPEDFLMLALQQLTSLWQLFMSCPAPLLSGVSNFDADNRLQAARKSIQICQVYYKISSKILQRLSENIHKIYNVDVKRNQVRDLHLTTHQSVLFCPFWDTIAKPRPNFKDRVCAGAG